MTDEQKRPEDETQDDGVKNENETPEPVPVPEDAEPVTQDQLEDIAEAVPDPTEYPEGQADLLEESLPDDPNVLEEIIVEAHRESEELTEAAPVQAFDSAVTAVQEAIESIPGPPDTVDEALAHAHLSDTTVLFGREIPYPIYTVVFFALGFLTITEVLLAELLASVEIIKIPLLLGIATAKAALVAIFYMHLNTDSRLFAITFVVPIAIALLATLFLLGIPAGY